MTAIIRETRDRHREEIALNHLEKADYIVISGMTAGTYGFPSTIADDDSVLHLAMSAPKSLS